VRISSCGKNNFLILRLVHRVLPQSHIIAMTSHLLVSCAIRIHPNRQLINVVNNDAFCVNALVISRLPHRHLVLLKIVKLVLNFQMLSSIFCFNIAVGLIPLSSHMSLLVLLLLLFVIQLQVRSIQGVVHLRV
jgi:hypothetical protein